MSCPQACETGFTTPSVSFILVLLAQGRPVFSLIGKASISARNNTDRARIRCPEHQRRHGLRHSSERNNLRSQDVPRQLEQFKTPVWKALDGGGSPCICLRMVQAQGRTDSRSHLTVYCELNGSSDGWRLKSAGFFQLQDAERVLGRNSAGTPARLRQPAAELELAVNFVIGKSGTHTRHRSQKKMGRKGQEARMHRLFATFSRK